CQRLRQAADGPRGNPRGAGDPDLQFGALGGFDPRDRRGEVLRVRAGQGARRPRPQDRREGGDGFDRGGRVMKIDLTGRAALVTGASRGIGREIAKALAGAGAKVACVATNEELLNSLVAEIGNGAIAIKCDVSKPAEI